MQVQAIVLSTVLLLCLPTLSMCEYEVINTGRFGIIPNTIELECRNNGVPLQGAVFWLNRVSRENYLLALGVDVSVRPNGRIVFQITRELEGTFFCGQNLENFGRVGQQLIAYPDRFIPPNNERTFFAKVGTTARLRCSILPGALRAQYFADWRNATSEVARLDGPRPSPPLSTTPDPRFMVNETTFALIIESVSLSDAGSYQCVLGVRDPAGVRLIYPQTETLDLTLVVYLPLSIDVALVTQTVSAGSPVTFECAAEGTSVEITWIYNGDTYTADNANVTTSRIDSAYVRSILELSSPSSSGFVICIFRQSFDGTISSLNNNNNFDNSLPEQITSSTARLIVTTSNAIIMPTNSTATAQCPPLPEIANGMISYSPDNTPDYNIGTVASYSCNQGYELVRNLSSRSVVRTCLDAGDGSGGTFTGQDPTCKPQCPPLPEIANGMISYSPDNTPDYNIETVATYSCNQGYELVRNPASVVRTCVDVGDGSGGTFTGQAPTCKPQCPPLPEIANGVISYSPDNTSDYNIGTLVTYNCNQGYVLVINPGSEMRTCVDAGDGSGGTFTGQAPTCKPICTVPVELTGATITATLVDGTTVDYDSVSNTVLEGTVLTYQCDNGLALSGSVNITCTSDGEWSSDPDLVECSQTGTPLSVSIVIGTTAAIIIIILFVSLSWVIVCVRIYKRRKLSRTQQPATDNVLTQRPIYPLSTPFDETSTTGRTSQVSLTDRHHSFKQSTDIDEEESTANETLNVTGKASEGSVEEVSSAIANAWSLILGNVMKLPDLSESLKIPGSQLKLSSDPIGQGETGMVYKGLLMNWKDEPLQAVAVKTLKGLFSSSDIQFLISEIIKMKDFNHPHVMPLIGVCLDAGPGVSMVMPHMTNGSVLDYLKKERSGLKLTDNCSKEKAQSVRKLLLRMCHQIALGMEYLSQQRFIHRDLAARNCMLDSSGDVRVGDFGLAEDVYSTGYFRQNERADIKLPYKWMALESLNDAIFTEKTDVWSYGVTMWEVFSCGQIPYPGVDVRTLVKFLQRGSRLDAPVNTACTTEISAVMQRCWLEDSEERPSFTDLSSIMDAMLSSVSGYAELNMELPHNSQDPIDMSGYDDLNEALRNRATRTDQ